MRALFCRWRPAFDSAGGVLPGHKAAPANPGNSISPTEYRLRVLKSVLDKNEAETVMS